ncbi:MAG: amino acid adenylation domain-containing protein [Clostridia bacterium]|nr:amino acid adenylation domain-containing protein [Clostridia bacterium]
MYSTKIYNLTKPQKLIYDMEKFTGGTIAIVCGGMLISTDKSVDEMKKAVNELYRLNDALRIRVSEENGQPCQYITEHTEQDIEVLSFDSKEELDNYASEYAKEPLDFYGSLCSVKIVILPDKKGVLAKLHHFISDAWTLSLIGTQFNKILNGEEVQVYSYTDYVTADEKYIESKRYAKDKDYFISQFKKCDEVTYISEKQAHTFEAKRATFVIDSENTSKILSYTKEKEVSAFCLFMSAVATYINRTKMNTDKFYIGTAVLNRNGAKEQNTMGMFINTAPILIELNNEVSFAENLNAVELSALSVLRHQKYNYGDLLEELRKNHNFTEKLYDIMLSYQNAKVLGDEVETTWYHSGMQTESLQIHIDDRDNEGIFRVHYDYFIEKFTEHEITKMHEHICNLLFDAITDDSKKIYELNILSTEEKQTLMFDFNDTAFDYPKDKCVHQLIEEQVAKTPDKIAVVACDKTLTYKKLNEEANKIAHSLIEKGIGRGDIVAFMLPRRSYLIATMIGILKSGAAYMPIDPDYPQDRIEYMLEDSGAKFCVTDKNITELLDNSNGNNLDTIVDSTDNCYCIYTSGSTGKPKGTIIRHNNFVNFCDNNNNNNYQVTAFNEGNTVLSIFKSCFDAFGCDSILMLLNNKTIVLSSEKEMLDADNLAEIIAEKSIDIIHATPSIIRTLCNSKKFLSTLKYIRILMIGAENFSPELYTFLKENTSAKIFNGYGPSETTIGVSFGELKSTDIHIGKPIANTQIYIVDKYMKPVPIGVTGELCIAGDCVGAGYLNRPELTAEKFIDNPFGKGKMYKTGDLAYWREDGNIAYVGRNDFQVKIRGLRIELGEIENAISSVDGINMSVVVVRKNSEGRQLICAFYTGEEKSVQEIKAVIGEKLPKYMLPHIFTHLDEMPLTSSGKISRKTLPGIDLENIETTVEYVAPKTEAEQFLVDSIKAVLGCEKVSTLDNFFDIGGDSLKAIELTSQLESKGYEVQVKTIFACETIGELAKELTAKAVETVKVEYGNVIPATPAQMRVYTAQSKNSDSTLYNIPYVFKVESLDVERLQIAINKLIERHESLRTHFENQNGHIMQVIDETASITVEKLACDDIFSFIRPFDLEKSPLLRVGYCENTVMIDIHHIISDGGTMPVFFRELNELYMGRDICTDVVQYGEFAVQEVSFEESEKYWLSVFDDEIPVLELPTDAQRTDKQSFNGNSVYDLIDIGLHNKITAKCKELNITPYVFYMSCFNILLSKFSGNEDVVVGMPVSGRDSHFLNTIGMFVNTIALRNKPEGNKTVIDLISEVKINSVSAIDNQNYPFGELVKNLNIETSGRNPLFDVMFAYQSEQMTDVVFGDKKAELLPVSITSAKCDFTFNIMPRNDDVVVMVEYCTDLYKEKKIQKFVDAFKLILEQSLYENTFIKDIEAMDEVEKNTLLFDFNDTEVDYPRDKCVHELFEKQVEKTPDNVAVIACDKTLTYKKLSEEANKIAHSLIEKGIGRGDIVAFMLPRRSYLIETMIGILKSGAAYMPIDPDYPQDRIEYMLSDSGAKFCVTDKNISELLDNSNVNNPDAIVDGTDNCYCIYTSGSTGKPKGTLLTHGNVVNYVNNNNNNVVHKIIKESYKNIVSVTTVGFDIFVTESLLPLANGMEIVLASEEQAKLQSKLNDLIKVTPADVLQTTPTKMKSLIVDKEQLDYLKTVKVIILGGEALEETLVEELKTLTDVEIFNIYGPTEATVWVTNAEIKDLDITIGKPIANTQIYIVDKYMKLVPIGVTGELCIAGDCVGAGYLNRPELTAEKFIDNPFGKGKMYKTGDLAYWREDGNIAYVGRNDFQVKIRGLRIELGEIENAISSVDGINMSVVVVRKNSEGRQLICAFYTGEEKCAQEIKSVIGEKLPKYMLPHIFTHLDEMPLTSSGKTNRNALPKVDFENISSEKEYKEPETPMQKALCKLLEQVFDVKQVGIDDDFFDDLGGDSLKVIEFVAEAHSEGIYFALQNVFDYPTIEKLCEFIEKGDEIKLQFADYDYSKVNEVLSRNKVEYISEPTKSDIGNILLAGATGYLGIHILADFLYNDSGIAYCLVRGKNQEESEKRFNELLNFYFDDKYNDTDRIVVICADLQKDKFGLTDSEYDNLLAKIDTVINCAASVKHYGSYKYFYEANVETTKRLIEFTKQADAVLIHTSTLSVSGNSFADQFDGYVSETEKHFFESTLYIEQSLENVYARSKFEAEFAVLEAIYDGLPAQIMRMGNLTNRFTDGKFQENYESNAFLQRIRAVLNLGVVPDYLMSLYSEFTPIDEAAEAVMTIARHFNKEQNVFHINSTKVVYLDKLLEYMNSLGTSMKTVSEKEFSAVLRKTMEQTQSKHIFEAFIGDMDENDRLNYDSNIRIENDFTVEYLRKLGFEWHDIGFEYIKKYIDYFRKIGFLEVQNG